MRWITVWIGFLLIATGAMAQPPAARVVVTPVFEKEIAPTAQLLGILDFDTKAGISAEISGLIALQKLTEGSLVPKGALLVRLNTDFIEKDLDILTEEIAELNFKIANTQKNLQRFETLFQQRVASEKDYDDLSSQLKELQAQKDALQVKLAKKQLELTKSTIRAPYNGLVLERYKNEGEWVAPGVSVCQLAAVDELVVQVALTEDLIRFIQVGQSLHFSIPALNRQFTGKVKAIVPKVDIKSKTFTIKISAPYEQGLMQNMTASVFVPAGPTRKLKMIKRDARVHFQGKDFVYTVQEGKAKIMPIQIEAVDGEFLGVDAPHITPGMVVVIDGNERLRPDQAVQIVKKPDGAAN